MKQIRLTKMAFPKCANSVTGLPFTKAALLRAVVAAGRVFGAVGKTDAARADIEMRINALRSALNMDEAILLPTSEYLGSGATDRSHKSFYVGNALCAHAAYSELKIPWLVDFEKLDSKYKIGKGAGKQRPDFLGQDASARWFVFEAKGRSTSPGPAALTKWKKQTKVVKQVNLRKIQQGIVSAAHLNKRNEWELLWVDPTPEDDAESVSFSEFLFFDAYYIPIIDFIEGDGDSVGALTDNMRPTRDASVYVGLHRI